VSGTLGFIGGELDEGQRGGWHCPHRTAREAVLAGSFVTVLGVLLGACGGKSATVAPAQRATAASLAPYLVRAGGETGYSLEGTPVLASSAAARDKGEAGEAAETRRLTEEGFRAALTVHTTGSNRAGVSFVLELGTPSAAQHEVAARFTQIVAEQHPSSQFTIATLPGSHGFEASGVPHHSRLATARETTPVVRLRKHPGLLGGRRC
jgi:hypothetical protein